MGEEKERVEKSNGKRGECVKREKESKRRSKESEGENS